jgi:hypothetical protein
MRRPSTWLTVGLVGALALSARTAAACGDKFVVVGRVTSLGQMKATANPASILIYSNPASRIPAAEREYRLASTLKRVGHKTLVLQDRVQVDEALVSRGFDLVLADFTDASSLEQTVRSLSPDTLVIPVLYKPSGAELAEAEKHYGCLLKASGKNDDLLTVVDEAMKSRAKGGGASCSKAK